MQVLFIERGEGGFFCKEVGRFHTVHLVTVMGEGDGEKKVDVRAGKNYPRMMKATTFLNQENRMC